MSKKNNEIFSIIKSNDNRLVKYIKSRLELFMKLPELYSEVLDIYDDPDILSSNILSSKSINVELVAKENLVNLSKGPTIIIFNHPHAIIDGLCLGYVLKKIIKEYNFKFISSETVPKVFQSLKTQSITVNNMDKVSHRKSIRNSYALREMLSYLKKNNTILIAPSGEASDLKFFSKEGICRVTDNIWSPSFVQLFLKTKATVIPVHISGRGTLCYQLISFFGATVKRIFNFREFLATKSKCITLTVREPILYDIKYESQTKEDLCDYFRKSLYER